MSRAGKIILSKIHLKENKTQAMEKKMVKQQNGQGVIAGGEWTETFFF